MCLPSFSISLAHPKSFIWTRNWQPKRAASVNPSLSGNIGGAAHIYDFFYLWGFTSAFVIYSLLGTYFPAEETLIPATIYEDLEVIDNVEYKNDGLGDQVEVGSLSGAEKGMKSAVDSVEWTFSWSVYLEELKMLDEEFLWIWTWMDIPFWWFGVRSEEEVSLVW
jgi:hypothetical protein